MKENFLNKSKANNYELSDEYSEFADRIIRDTIFKLLNYFSNKSLTVINKKTYNIKLPNKTLKTASYTIKIRGKNINEGHFEISNPFEFEGTRIWTSYKGLGKFWTDINIIIKKDLDPDVIVCFLIQDYEKAYELLKLRRKYSEQIFDIESFIEDEIEHDNIDKEKEVLKVFNDVFNTN